MPQYVVIAGPEFKRVEAALAKADAEFPKRFERRIKQLAEPLAAAAASRVLSLPTPSNAGHTGLRSRVAAGVGVRANQRAGVRITTSMADPSERAIPRGLDNGPRGWRHPVFGNRANWVTQPGYSWFLETMQDSRRAFERGLTDVIEEAAQDIAQAGGGAL
jgi:hypothetical protein